MDFAKNHTEGRGTSSGQRGEARQCNGRPVLNRLQRHLRPVGVDVAVAELVGDLQCGGDLAHIHAQRTGGHNTGP